jgi:hypothetical protein
MNDEQTMPAVEFREVRNDAGKRASNCRIAPPIADGARSPFAAKILGLNR